MTVQTTPGKTTEFAVECEFSTLGDCGRHRFTAHDERLDMLFKVTFDRKPAPNSPGRLVINSDVSGTGNSLDLLRSVCCRANDAGAADHLRKPGPEPTILWSTSPIAALSLPS